MTFTQQFITGDINRDGSVDASDFLELILPFKMVMEDILQVI
jgi:hypothetical protein